VLAAPRERGSKLALVIELLRRGPCDGGDHPSNLTQATGWLPQNTNAGLPLTVLLRKRGIPLVRERDSAPVDFQSIGSCGPHPPPAPPPPPPLLDRGIVAYAAPNANGNRWVFTGP